MHAKIRVVFSWPDPKGHDWVEAFPVNDDWTIGEQATWVLVPRDVSDVFVDFWERPVYRPLEENSGLFRDFAALSVERNQFLEFANRYGSLKQGQLFLPVGVKRPVGKPPSHCLLSHLQLSLDSDEWLQASSLALKWVGAGAVFGDSEDLWRSNIRKLKALIEVWENIKDRNQRELKKYLRVEPDPDGKSTRITWTGPAEKYWSSVSYFDLLQPHNVLDAAHLEMERTICEETTSGSDLYVSFVAKAHLPELAVQPKSLRDAIWLQFAVAVCENKSFRQCDICGKAFEVSPDVARTNRRLCSPACKAKAHRKRRTQALALADKGLSVKQIAEHVGSEVATVKKWLAEAKEQKNGQEAKRKR